MTCKDCSIAHAITHTQRRTRCPTSGVAERAV